MKKVYFIGLSGHALVMHDILSKGGIGIHTPESFWGPTADGGYFEFIQSHPTKFVNP